MLFQMSILNEVFLLLKQNPDVVVSLRLSVRAKLMTSASVVLSAVHMKLYICHCEHVSIQLFFWRGPYRTQHPWRKSGRPVEMSEDCLYLNVYRPAGTASGDDLPIGIRAHTCRMIQLNRRQWGGGNMAVQISSME